MSMCFKKQITQEVKIIDEDFIDQKHVTQLANVKALLLEFEQTNMIVRVDVP